jgi:hypothetical protein
MAALALALAPALGAGLGGCGLDLKSADLFVLTRTGQGPKLTLLLNDGGTISCNGSKPKRIPDSLLIAGRDVADSLNTDAQAKLKIPARPTSVYFYTVRLQNGTISFSDTSVRGHKDLAQAELFAAQAAQSQCGLSG